MPTETRIFRADSHTVNGLTAKKLGTSYGTSMGVESATGRGNVRVYWGIRVWKRSQDGTETEITGGSPVARVVRLTDGMGIQSATWSCPGASLSPTDSIVVRVYASFGGTVWQLLETWTTEQLGATQLDAATWTVYYYTRRFYYSTRNLTYGYFRYGTSDYPSRIENFKYTIGPVTQELSEATSISDVCTLSILTSLGESPSLSDVRQVLPLVKAGESLSLSPLHGLRLGFTLAEPGWWAHLGGSRLGELQLGRAAARGGLSDILSLAYPIFLSESVSPADSLIASVSSILQELSSLSDVIFYSKPAFMEELLTLEDRLAQTLGVTLAEPGWWAHLGGLTLGRIRLGYPEPKGGLEDRLLYTYPVILEEEEGLLDAISPAVQLFWEELLTLEDYLRYAYPVLLLELVSLLEERALAASVPLAEPGWWAHLGGRPIGRIRLGHGEPRGGIEDRLLLPAVGIRAGVSVGDVLFFSYPVWLDEVVSLAEKFGLVWDLGDAIRLLDSLLTPHLLKELYEEFVRGKKRVIRI